MPILKCEVDECIYWMGNECQKQVVTLRKAIATIADPEGVEEDETYLIGAICSECADDGSFDGDDGTLPPMAA